MYLHITTLATESLSYPPKKASLLDSRTSHKCYCYGTYTTAIKKAYHR
uniref:Uncharacterized protein n=1 Tax=Rhizophora mucronata TaxID=61149 RepID=A0A2P2NF50_RHIMU